MLTVSMGGLLMGDEPGVHTGPPPRASAHDRRLDRKYTGPEAQTEQQRTGTSGVGRKGRPPPVRVHSGVYPLDGVSLAAPSPPSTSRHSLPGLIAPERMVRARTPRSNGAQSNFQNLFNRSHLTLPAARTQESAFSRRS